MPRTVTIEQHAVFVTLDTGAKFRVSEWMDWSPAIDRWQAMDDQRRDAVQAKGLVTLYNGAAAPSVVRHYEVRSENDPAYADLPMGEHTLVSNFRVLSREYTTEAAAAKAVLKPLGYFSRAGGWVYYYDDRHPGLPRVLTQGWFQAATSTGHPVVRLDGEKGYRAVVTTMLQVHCEIGVQS